MNVASALQRQGGRSAKANAAEANNTVWNVTRLPYPLSGVA